MAKNATATIAYKPLPPGPNVVSHLVPVVQVPVPISISMSRAMVRKNQTRFSIKMDLPRNITTSKIIFKVQRAKMGPERIELFISNYTKDVNIIAHAGNILTRDTRRALDALLDKAPVPDDAFMYGVVVDGYLHLLLDEGLAPHQVW